MPEPTDVPPEHAAASTTDAFDVEQLEGWDPISAPPNFADRVVDAWNDERSAVADRKGSRFGGNSAWVVIAATAAAMVLLWATSRPISEGPSDGALLAEHRQTVALGGRAVAVTEPGADLSWRIDDDGRARVDQRAGVAFYRVDPGPAFEVTTPHGSIAVTGTCFAVEITDMKPGLLKGMAAGAALSAAVVVTVYEGGVVLADEGREIEVGPGQRAMAGDARGPRRLGDDPHRDSGGSGGDSRELEELARLDPGALASRVRSQARELERLRTAEADRTAELQRLAAEVESLGGDVAPKTAKAAAKRCAGATRDTPGCSFVEPDQETLLEMARCSTVKVDVPGFLNHDEAIAPPSAEQRAAAGLSEQESGSLTQAGERFRRQYGERMQQLYLEAGGIPEAIDGMPAGAIQSMTGAFFHNEELAHARRRLAQERAGLIEVDKAALSLADHYVRHLLNAGDAYEEVVAEALGPERARELRLLDDGWSGGTSVYSGDCEE